MSGLASALGKKFVQNKEEIRTREFQLGGHTFKVRVPLTVEVEATQKKIKNLDEELVEKYYQELTKDLQANKKDMPEELKVVYKDNDIIVDGRSMREASRNKVLMESRIVEMFKLLVPEDKGFDMETITYKDVDELFPLSIQMQVVEAISEVISFNYTANKEK